MRRRRLHQRDGTEWRAVELPGGWRGDAVGDLSGRDPGDDAWCGREHAPARLRFGRNAIDLGRRQRRGATSLLDPSGWYAGVRLQRAERSDRVDCLQLDTARPPGPATFAVTLYSGPNATGSVLSSGSISTTIVSGKLNDVAVTFNGVPAALVVELGTSSPPSGTPLVIPVIVYTVDAAGYAIIGRERTRPPRFPTPTHRRRRTCSRRRTVSAAQPPGQARSRWRWSAERTSPPVWRIAAQLRRPA